MSDFLSFRLSEEFMDGYKNLKPDWGYAIGGGNFLSELVYVNKYSSLKEDGTKEKWFETCQRVIEGMYSILKDHCKKNKTPWNDLKAQKSARDAYDRMFHFKWTPPGRGLQHMGREAIHVRQDSSFLQNCFAGSEMIITSEGPKAFIDILGEDVIVWTSDGWAPAVVQEFGTQMTQRVTFKPLQLKTSVLHDIVVTPDHRWILRDNTETTNLAVGDIVKNSVTISDENSPEYFDGLLHGLIFGDGGKTSYQYADGRNGFELRACENRTQDLANHPELKSRWTEIYKDRPSGKGDWFFFIKTFDELKELPVGKSPNYLHGFMNGWIACDANISGSGSYRLDSQRSDTHDWLCKHAASAGYQLVGFTQEFNDTNFGKRKSPLNRFTLRDNTTTVDWLVTSIEPLEESAVYCAVVPSTGSFTLASGIYTGNCGYLTTAKLSAHSSWEAVGPFVRMMEMSMAGVGVGFDLRGAGSITLHQPIKSEEPPVFVVSDTREGWAEAIGALLETFFFKNREEIIFDVSEIRPAGSPLKSFGGRASGPGPLVDCINQITELLSGRDGDKITSRDITDIMNLIGKAVVAGGARRSAQIAFGSMDDMDYISIKDWNLPENKLRTDKDLGWAWNSNNSVFVEGEIPESIIDKTMINGEPGFMWLDMAQQYGRIVDPPTNADYRVMGANPCLAADNWIMTVNGPRQVIDLIDSPTNLIVNGKEYSASGFWETGVKQVYRLVFSDGRTLRVTGNHQILLEDDTWVEAENLEIGAKVKLHNHENLSWDGDGSFDDGYVVGLFLGDGSFQSDRATLCTWSQDIGSESIKVEAERIVEEMGVASTFKGWGGPFGNGWYRLSTKALTDHVESWGLQKGDKHIKNSLEKKASSDFTRGLLRGLFDADGSVQGTQLKGVSVRLSQSNLSDIQAVQRMLSRLGINSTVYSRQDERLTELPDGNGDVKNYLCKPSWELVVSNDSIIKYKERIGFTHSEKKSKLDKIIDNYKRTPNKDKFTSQLISIEEDGIESVYDVKVEEVHCLDANGIVVHNCNEQSLEPNELCTLVETFPSKHDSFEDFRETLKAAYLYAKAVTLLPTPWPESNEVMARNRRIGCSMSGLVEFIEERGWNNLKTWMDEGYQFILHRDRKYSEWLAVRESIKKTSIKPSGTVSLVAGVTPGVHWPVNGGSHIRRVRFSVNDPIVSTLIEAGYPVEPMEGDPKNTIVATFVTNSADVRSEREVSIWEKAELAVMAQRWWADNQVSATITFLPHESDQISPLLASKSGQLKGISFLPLGDEVIYAQAPYEPISPEDAKEFVSSVKKIKNLYKIGGEAVGDKFCDNDTCTI